MEIILTKQEDGRWFGRVPWENITDQNGNEIDCLLDTPEEALKCILEQISENSTQ